MIKINLLNSVTDRVGGGSVAAVVEQRVVDPKTQSFIIAGAVAFVMIAVMGFDYFSANANQRRADEELAEQQRIQQQMQAIIKEQTDLEQKTAAINARIAAIQALRSTQKGPVAVLSAINERIPQVANFHLEKIDQKGGNLVITGDSPSEEAVTQFGRSLEFSSGLFSNVSIEIQRKAVDVAGANSATSAPKAETVNFTIKCGYTPQLPTPAAAAPAAIPPVAPATK